MHNFVMHCKIFKAKSALPPYPDGWYRILFSEELKNSDVKSVRALGRELVVWRNEDGIASIFGAYCPHLGANLSIGGIVEENCLKCPFHGWRFDTSGSPRDAPGCGDKPPYGKAEVYLCAEKNGMIMVWLGAKRDGPRRGRGMLSAVAPAETAGWLIQDEPLLAQLQLVGIGEYIVSSHIQQISEHSADSAHIAHAHVPFNWPFSWFFSCEWQSNWIPGSDHTAVAEHALSIKAFGRTLISVKLQQTLLGPSIIQQRISLPFGLGQLFLSSTATPTSPTMLINAHALYCSRNMPRFVGKLLLSVIQNHIDQDVAIWSSKNFQAKPFYSQADSNLSSFRYWFLQFYSENSETFAESMATEKDSIIFDW
jgi:cholesterol 7-dehydrogenase